MDLHKFNDFSDEFINAFAKKILAKKATGANRLEGKIFEQFLCDIFGTEWKGSNDGLVDVQVGDTGFSVKSLEFAFPVITRSGGRKSMRTIIGRCAPDYHGKHINKNKTPPDEAGEIVTRIWNERYDLARERCTDFRTFSVLKSHDLDEFVVFECLPNAYDPLDFKWEWVTRNCRGKDTTNLRGTYREISLTWQPHGAQFSLTKPVPDFYRHFKLKEPRKLSEDYILGAAGVGEHNLSEWVVCCT